MGRPRRLGQSVLMAVCLATAVTAGSPHNLFERAKGVCLDTAFSLCPQTGLPDGFCCPPTSVCIPLAANSTVLCCPNNSNGTPGDCSTIKPISCDITLQNMSTYHDNTLKTTYLGVPLPTCAGLCCPFGYSCNSSGNCIMNADQSVLPGVGTAPATTNTASSTTSTSPASTSSPASANNGTPTVAPITETCNKFPIAAILAGFFPGLALGAILALASICLLGAHRRRGVRRRSGSSFGNISEPVPTSDTRTDFLRKPPPTPSTTAGSSSPSRRSTMKRVRSIFGKTPEQTSTQSPVVPPIPLNIRRQQEQRPVTPVNQRDSSYEDINIFADGDTASSLRERERNNALQAGRNDVRASHQTTFSDMMERSAGGALAGLPKGQRELYSSSIIEKEADFNFNSISL